MCIRDRISGWGLLFGPMFMQRSVQRLLEYLDILKSTPLGLSLIHI